MTGMTRTRRMRKNQVEYKGAEGLGLYLEGNYYLLKLKANICQARHLSAFNLVSLSKELNSHHGTCTMHQIHMASYPNLTSIQCNLRIINQRIHKHVQYTQRRVKQR